MMKFNDDVTLVGLAELREEMPKLAKDLKFKTVIITNRGKPVAVMEDFKQYEENKEILDAFEDIVLGHLALERMKNSKDTDYLSEKEFKKKAGLS